MSYMNQSGFSAENGLTELSFDEIDQVDGGVTAREVGIASGIGGAVLSAAGVGLSLSAAGPVGFAVGFGIGMAGVFMSSAGIGASLASK